MTEQLGFALVIDEATDHARILAVAPPDGNTLVALVTPGPGSPQQDLVGRSSLVLITDDIQALYDTWRARGVAFTHPPLATNWGGVITALTDPDGNTVALMSHDDMTRELLAQRRAAVEREERERRAVHEMDIAREVQARLLPQEAPPSRTLDWAGRCLQARQVGGDYYDFLPLGPGRTALVVGDISGKGIAAALLMANLQASLRGQAALAADEPLRALPQVNRHVFENSPPSAYATLFFAEYREEDGRLRYASCGHPPALLLRASGGVEELHATTTVLGLFADWECAAAETRIEAGDTLVLYSDGVTECSDAAGVEFGPARLADLVRRDRGLGAAGLIDSIVAELRRFGGAEQGDDITLIVARRLPNAGGQRPPHGQ